MDLQHRSATGLKHVGQQLWRGALLLSEAILARRDELRGRTLLELGAGLGLASIVAARVARPARVIVTDMDDEAVLDLARANVAANVGSREEKRVDVVVRALDWEKEEGGSGGGGDDDGIGDLDGDGAVGVILAADVVYDDRLTDALFAVLRRLLWPPLAGGPTPNKTRPAPYCLLALERRPVFSSAHMRVIAPGYDRFREQLEWGNGRTPWPLEGRRLDVTAVPLAYLGEAGTPPWRGGEGDDGCLELWEIRARVEQLEGVG